MTELEHSFDALSFDCYGTLIDWETGIGDALAHWAAAAGCSARLGDLMAAFARHETAVQSEQPTLVYPAVLMETLRRIGEDHSVEVTAEQAAEFGSSVGRWPAFPDSAPALTRLKERFALIILSNVDRGSFATSNARLEVEFDLIVTAQDVGSYKPDPKNFEALFESLGQIGITRARLLHVAQSLYHDHDPARALGLPSVWIDRRQGRPGSGATPPPKSNSREIEWRFPSMAAFADAILG